MAKNKKPDLRVTPIQLLTLLQTVPPRGMVIFGNMAMSWSIAIAQALDVAKEHAPKPRKPRAKQLTELPTIPV